MNQPNQQNVAMLASLSDKHRACLDLALRRRMTSKQIARELGISKDAVDQRMASARRLLGARDRDEAVLKYAALVQNYDQIVYDPVELHWQPPSEQLFAPGHRDAPFLSLSEAPMHHAAEFEKRRPTMFLGVSIDQLGEGHRLVIIAIMSVAIMVMVLIALAISQSLSSLIAA